jgi:transposase
LVVVARRCGVERTFSWFGRNRRLAKEYENPAEPLSLIILAAIS